MEDEPENHARPDETKDEQEGGIPIWQYVLLGVLLVVLGGLVVVKTFGKTVSKKFRKTNSGVEEMVRYGGGGGGSGGAPSGSGLESSGSGEGRGQSANIGQLGKSGSSPEKKAARGAKRQRGSSREVTERTVLDKLEGSSETKPESPSSEESGSNTEEYEDHGVNQMTQTSKDAKSTFAVDVDTGSYTIAREKLRNDQLPPASSVRVEEFVNYFDYDYPQPESGPFTVDLEAAPSPFSAEDNHYLMRVGVQGQRVTRKTRKPYHLTFLIDTSGSMGDPGKLPLAKEALKYLTHNLDERDTVSLATYAGSSKRVLEPTPTAEKEKVVSAIESLGAGGSTAMSSGLKMAYEMAEQKLDPDHVNRVIVVSDGDANVGPSSHQAILDEIETYVDKGIRLSTIGVGMGNYKDTTMEQLANEGNGNYHYIDTIEEARRLFGEKLESLMQVIAKDVKIQVEFREEVVPSYRLIGYENRNIKDKNFRNESVDAGEIGAGHTVTALYEVNVRPEAEDELATVRVRHKKPNGDEAHEQAFPLAHGDLKEDLQKTSKDFQFATAVVGFAEMLRDSPYAKHVSYGLVEEVASPATKDRSEREQFVEIVRVAKGLDDRHD